MRTAWVKPWMEAWYQQCGGADGCEVELLVGRDRQGQVHVVCGHQATVREARDLLDAAFVAVGQNGRTNAAP